MTGDYEVFFGNQPAGRVQVTRQGLYYRFVCLCKLTGDVVCRLYVSCGGQREILGVVVPTGEGFGLDTRQSVKRFRAGEPSLSLVPKNEMASGQFAPIVPEEPFAYIERLKTSFLVKKYGQMGSLLENYSEISNPTGQ